MKRLILVAAAPNRFCQQHEVPPGQWVITDASLSQVYTQLASLRVHEILDAKQGAMQFNDNEICFITNQNDPLFSRIMRDSQTRDPREHTSSYGPVFKLKTNHGILRWFVSNPSGRRAIQDLSLEAGFSFTLKSHRVTNRAHGWTYWIPEVVV